METTKNEPIPQRTGLVDSVLLIDGDNDPHMPADFPLSPSTLVKVFLRPKATLPRTLQKRLSPLPMCVTIAAPQGGKNAADFVMSLHAGLLHASLPLHLPFTVITNDKGLGAIVQELQRVGRVATLWTSHPERAAASAGASGRVRRSRGGRARGRKAAAPAPEAPAPAPASVAPAGDLKAVAESYMRMLLRAKNPPIRLKALLNDIGNRTANSGLASAEILDELKRGHGLLIDERGRVTLPRP
ncbi:MAG: hypothetical protein PHF00_01670 [Elusimicrobia bacterium]|nr:hypothetical protein [Elusimicrobiota bacterium]